MKRPIKIADLGVLTTGQVAALCQVSPKTVSRWIDDGHLAGWKVPGTKDRRVSGRELIAFLEGYGMDDALRAYRRGSPGVPRAPGDEVTEWEMSSSDIDAPGPAGGGTTPKETRSAKVRAKYVPKELTDSGYVYFVQLSQGSSIKIGFSYDPARRMRQFQEGSPTPIRCLGIMFGGRRLERRLHQDFASLQISGEWFEPDRALLRYIADHSIPLNAITEDDAPGSLTPKGRSLADTARRLVDEDAGR